MFDISAEDISLLSDEDLRELIGRLCEADLRRNGLSPLAATWGGDQNAADGGVDVRVATVAEIPAACAIVRPNVGYQVKAEDMPRGKILSEMRPGGLLRASIRDLADLRGAYVIVSSKGSVSDAALRERKRAMSEAVAELANASDLHTDFYDRNRVATWVRQHPGVIAWVRERIGRAIPGWRPYDDWTGSNQGAEGAYLADGALRIQGPEVKGAGLPALEGILRLRRILEVEHGIVRLVGLSGTGKTRLAQALFDRRVGEGGLSPELAIYANLSDDPNPQPVALATGLVAQGQRHVLVIDNCPPELHGRLSEICRKTESKLSLLTIEYDVREDQPEGTDVFELQPSSTDLIEKILLQRVKGLSDVNARSIALFSSGNARVALALASTVEAGESVATLRDAELFERLFRQRQESSNSLMPSAQACSLPYSFQGEDRSSGKESELPKLAAVVGKDLRSLNADIAELERRNLIQRRGVWRALLPHAIANRLATMALENILPEDLERLFATAPPRLLKSISRRLGYLHTSDAAQRLTREWLGDGGRLGRAEELNEIGRAMFVNVAPVAPVSVLDAIERAQRRQGEIGARLEGEEFRTLLLSLAFESELFDRSVALILDLIEFEEPTRLANQVRNSFPSLFHLCLSGTHATVEQRIRVIDTLLRSSSGPRQELGLAALDAMLQTSHFSSVQQFDFGGRPRDYGYFPKTRGEVLKWFRAALELCAALDSRDSKTSSRVRTVVSKHLHGLWTQVEMFDEVENICRQFHRARFWPEGWAAIRSIRRFEAGPPSEDAMSRLTAIEKAIAPRSLAERVRGRVLRSLRDAYDDIDLRDHEAQFLRQQQELIELGEVLAEEFALLDELMSELIACNTGITLGPFVRGLMNAANDHRAFWGRLVAAFKISDPTTRSTELLACYLFNLQSLDPELLEELLRDAQEDPCLSEWFPVLQTRVGISSAGALRLKKSLTQGNIPAERFRSLAYIGTALDDRTILDLVPMILNMENGFSVALEVVWMRFPHGRPKHDGPSPELLAAGRLVAEAFDFERRSNHDTYSLGQVIEACLSSAEGVPVVERMLEKLKAKHSRYGFSFVLDDDLLGALAAAQPAIVLHALFASEVSNNDIRIHGPSGHYDHVVSPFNRIPPAVLCSWCDEAPSIRYPLAASVITAFYSPNNSSERRWNEIALALLDRAPDRIAVLKHYIDQFAPMGWSGSRAQAWETNAQLLDAFTDHPDSNLAAFVRSERLRVKTLLDQVRQEELQSERRENERFE